MESTGTFILPALANPPAAPVEGQKYYDTGLKRERLWTGAGGWVDRPKFAELTDVTWPGSEPPLSVPRYNPALDRFEMIDAAAVGGTTEGNMSKYGPVAVTNAAQSIVPAGGGAGAQINLGTNGWGIGAVIPGSPTRPVYIFAEVTFIQQTTAGAAMINCSITDGSLTDDTYAPVPAPGNIAASSNLTSILMCKQIDVASFGAAQRSFGFIYYVSGATAGVRIAATARNTYPAKMWWEYH